MGIRSVFRGWLEQVLAEFGYGLRILGAPPRGYREFLRLYRSAAPLPQTVFDIGVGEGTPWLYEAFPESRFVLVEPLKEFESHIQDICRKYVAEAHYCCLGAAEGETEFEVRPWDLMGSGLPLGRKGDAGAGNGLAGRATEMRRIPVRTLDSLARGRPLPSIIKIDVEGSELDVLRGGVQTVRAADLILLETSLAGRLMIAPDLIDVGAWLKTQGFQLFDILEIATRGQNRIPCYVDVAFLRADSESYKRLAGV